jgi:hypothetical protein
LLDQPDADSASRHRLVQVVADAAYTQNFDRAELLDAIWAVFDSGDEGRILGIPPLAIRPEQFADFLAVRLSGLRVALTVTEDQLVRVWHANQAARPGWEELRPKLAPQVTREAERRLFAEETEQQLFDNAPTTVLTLLGLFFGNNPATVGSESV